MPGYVNSLATQLMKTVKPDITTQVATEEQTKERKAKFLSILDEATESFMDKLAKGSVSMNSLTDFEKIVKLTLLLSGEADSISGKSAQTETNTTVNSSVNPAIDNMADLLDVNDPDVQAVYDKIFNAYNDANDAVK